MWGASLKKGWFIRHVVMPKHRPQSACRRWHLGRPTLSADRAHICIAHVIRNWLHNIIGYGQSGVMWLSCPSTYVILPSTEFIVTASLSGLATTSSVFLISLFFRLPRYGYVLISRLDDRSHKSSELSNVKIQQRQPGSSLILSHQWQSTKSEWWFLGIHEAEVARSFPWSRETRM